MGNTDTSYQKCLTNQYDPYISQPDYNSDVADGIKLECIYTRSVKSQCYVMISLLVLIFIPMVIITIKVKQLVWK